MLTWKLHIKEEKILYWNSGVLNAKLVFVTSLKTLSEVFNFFGIYFIYKYEKSEHLTPMVFLCYMGGAGAMKTEMIFVFPWAR